MSCLFNHFTYFDVLHFVKEYLAKKNDHSLFMFGFDSKKRPNSLIVGRFFDNQVTDMFEFGMENFIPMEDFKVNL